MMIETLPYCIRCVLVLSPAPARQVRLRAQYSAREALTAPRVIALRVWGGSEWRYGFATESGLLPCAATPKSQILSRTAPASPASASSGATGRAQRDQRPWFSPRLTPTGVKALDLIPASCFCGSPRRCRASTDFPRRGTANSQKASADGKCVQNEEVGRSFSFHHSQTQPPGTFRLQPWRGFWLAVKRLRLGGRRRLAPRTG